MSAGAFGVAARNVITPDKCPNTTPSFPGHHVEALLVLLKEREESFALIRLQWQGWQHAPIDDQAVFFCNCCNCAGMVLQPVENHRSDQGHLGHLCCRLSFA